MTAFFTDKHSREFQYNVHINIGRLMFLWDFKIGLITARKRSCEKVMFLQVSVILFTGGGAWSGGGACSQGGGVPGPGRCLVETPRMATAAGSTHPTGMHSCFVMRYVL